MTGRLWRYGLTIMPHMIAGIGCPSEEKPVRHAGAAPAQARDALGALPCDEQEVCDGRGPNGNAIEEPDEVLSDPDVP